MWIILSCFVCQECHDEGQIRFILPERFIVHKYVCSIHTSQFYVPGVIFWSKPFDHDVLFFYCFRFCFTCQDFKLINCTINDRPFSYYRLLTPGSIIFRQATYSLVGPPGTGQLWATKRSKIAYIIGAIW